MVLQVQRKDASGGCDRRGFAVTIAQAASRSLKRRKQLLLDGCLIGKKCVCVCDDAATIRSWIGLVGYERPASQLVVRVSTNGASVVLPLSYSRSSVCTQTQCRANTTRCQGSMQSRYKPQVICIDNRALEIIRGPRAHRRLAQRTRLPLAKQPTTRGSVSHSSLTEPLTEQPPVARKSKCQLFHPDALVTPCPRL